MLFWEFWKTFPATTPAIQISGQCALFSRRKASNGGAFPSDCMDKPCVSSKYPREVTWTVGFDGKKLGQVSGRTQQEFGYYSEVGLQDIVAPASPPTIGARSRDYSGFLSTPVFRPLITNSYPFVKDPDFWKPAQLPAKTVAAVRHVFREQFPKVSNCDNPDDINLKEWKYTDTNIRVLKSYKSRADWQLAQVRLEEYRCDGQADEPFGDQWYVVTPKLEISFLDREMWLVDAGDYDNDGKSELVFSIDRYDQGGYELFYDDFKKHVSFEFSYH